VGELAALVGKLRVPEDVLKRARAKRCEDGKEKGRARQGKRACAGFEHVLRDRRKCNGSRKNETCGPGMHRTMHTLILSLCDMIIIICVCIIHIEREKRERKRERERKRKREREKEGNVKHARST
jgi:hypothetical protein